MSSDERRKQAKQQKRRAREKAVRKARNVSHNISLRDYVLQLSRGEWCNCYESGEMGMSDLVCIRKNYRGFGASMFLLDEYCLGVKDAKVRRDIQLSAIEEYMKDRGARIVSPSYALKKILTLIAWAREIGFEPNANTFLAMEIFRGVDPDACPETFAFGRPEDGKPMYISGPYDGPERIRAILATLQRLGPENHYFAVEAHDSLRRSLMLNTAKSQEQQSDEADQSDEAELLNEVQLIEVPRRFY